MIRNFPLAKGMFLTKIPLAKSIQSKTGAAHPSQKILEYPLPSPMALKWCTKLEVA